MMAYEAHPVTLPALWLISPARTLTGGTVIISSFPSSPSEKRLRLGEFGFLAPSHPGVGTQPWPEVPATASGLHCQVRQGSLCLLCGGETEAQGSCIAGQGRRAEVPPNPAQSQVTQSSCTPADVGAAAPEVLQPQG